MRHRFRRLRHLCHRMGLLRELASRSRAHLIRLAVPLSVLRRAASHGLAAPPQGALFWFVLGEGARLHTNPAHFFPALLQFFISPRAASRQPPARPARAIRFQHLEFCSRRSFRRPFVLGVVPADSPALPPPVGVHGFLCAGRRHCRLCDRHRPRHFRQLDCSRLDDSLRSRRQFGWQLPHRIRSGTARIHFPRRKTRGLATTQSRHLAHHHLGTRSASRSAGQGRRLWQRLSLSHLLRLASRHYPAGLV